MRLIDEDLKSIWHPCAQMKDYEAFKPLPIVGASGSYLHLQDGRTVIDAISSWWCKSLGHGHPQLKEALHRQIEQFEHVLLANTTHEVIVSLSKQLLAHNPSFGKVLFASDGSSIIEMALKMSLHAHRLMGHDKRNQLMALSGAYHGETLLALSVSDCRDFCKAYQPWLLSVPFLKHIPYVSSMQDPLWADCSAIWPAIERELAPYAETLAAIIVEPIVQGAAGMRIYSQDFLKRLAQWTQQQGIHLVVDEIMTGFGRTGPWFAYQHADIQPDFLCLGKGLTGGCLPMSALLIPDTIYHCFYADYNAGRNFLHSHTHSGNAMAAAVANQVCQTMVEEAIIPQVERLSRQLADAMHRVQSETGCVSNVRQIGGIAACDLIIPPEKAGQRLGYAVYQAGVRRGALLRPIGNCIYWLPPLNTPADVLEKLCVITIDAICEVMS